MRRRIAVAGCGLAALLLAPRCADYARSHKATMTVWDVRLVKTEAEVAGCRFLANVDSRDAQRGCGSTVQPTPEECLRYQVRYAGGDTLLINGPMGKAYACGPEEPAPEAAPAAASAASPTRAPAAPSTPAPAAPPTAAPAPASAAPSTPAPAASPTTAPAEPRPSVRVTEERGAARGCVYVGDVPAAVACGDAAPACVEEARRAGGNLVVVSAGTSQIFACPARP